MTVNGPVFDLGPALPRGPHDLSRHEVSSSQVMRINAAMAALVAEAGYPDVTIGAIARRAGVSRATFYQHYQNKEACYIAAYLHFGRVLSERLVDAVPAEADWETLVDAVLSSYLGLLDADPAAARAFVLEIDAAGPAARAEGRKLYAQMAAFVQDLHATIRRSNPTFGALDPEAYVAMVHGVRGLVRDVLDTETSPQLLDHMASLRSWVVAVIRGA